MENKEIMLGNGAIALGLLEAGCQVMTSYPGTPSSEILPEAMRLNRAHDLGAYMEWSTNEKVALDTAFAAAVAGKRSACIMKQVGLNVAADSLMSAAYLGTVGGLVIVSCDDPGPHSSQTEQDTRLMARLAKVPVFDPANPQQAREMARTAMEVSEAFRIPVILRPAIRVCHARQSLTVNAIARHIRPAAFEKNPARWAATPKFRYRLHIELNEKLAAIARRFETLDRFNGHNLQQGRTYPLGIITGGVPTAVVADILADTGRTDIPVLAIGTPYPFPEGVAAPFLDACRNVLVIEETDTLMEYLLRDRHKVMGRLSGHVPAAGELVPEVVHRCIHSALDAVGAEGFGALSDDGAATVVDAMQLPVRRPTLCPGCPHRASFFAIRKARPKAIFTSDIGCYTLGLNLGGVDTCLDMGAAITMAAGFYHAFAQDGVQQPIVATLGDSTFFHSGTAGLLSAVYNDARFILVILDNQITAMTGMQPTPALGIRADGTPGKTIALERVVSGCGVDFIKVVDPYDLKAMNRTLKKASAYVADPNGGIAVIIARHPCVIAYRETAIPEKRRVTITDDCTECNFCRDRFECPALVHNAALGRTDINRQICTDCGLCIQICPKKAIVEDIA